MWLSLQISNESLFFGGGSVNLDTLVLSATFFVSSNHKLSKKSKKMFVIELLIMKKVLKL